MCKQSFCILLAVFIALASFSACALSREEMRAAYGASAALRSDEPPYAVVPNVLDFSSIGEIASEKIADALRGLNFIRSIAGVREAQLSELYSLRCQNAALLLASNDEISHNPARPEGMHTDLYQSGLLGAQGSNLACLNWIGPDILIDAIEYFVRDDGENNLSTLGHRRWLLSPAMAETGFGLASAESGASYITMYAVDDGYATAAWDYVAWPAGGAFPVELMGRELAWSISLNDSIYNLDASRPVVTLSEENSGASFRFEPAYGRGDGFCTLDREPIGGGSCIIFRPNLTSTDIVEYQQNQNWNVQVSGLILRNATPAEITYRCEMASLYPQDAVNIELSQLEAVMLPGESLQLRAQVIPTYADNLSVRWLSTDGGVAIVNTDGMVTALGEGSCQVIAESANGRQDICEITVKAKPQN